MAMRPFSSVRCSNRGSALILLDCSPVLNQPRVLAMPRKSPVVCLVEPLRVDRANSP